MVEQHTMCITKGHLNSIEYENLFSGSPTHNVDNEKYFCKNKFIRMNAFEKAHTYKALRKLTKWFNDKCSSTKQKKRFQRQALIIWIKVNWNHWIFKHYHQIWSNTSLSRRSAVCKCWRYLICFVIFLLDASKRHTCSIIHFIVAFLDIVETESIIIFYNELINIWGFTWRTYTERFRYLIKINFTRDICELNKEGCISVPSEVGTFTLYRVNKPSSISFDVTIYIYSVRNSGNAATAFYLLSYWIILIVSKKTQKIIEQKDYAAAFTYVN